MPLSESLKAGELKAMRDVEEVHINRKETIEQI